ncbi:hypothetical protein [Thauera aminoaromatica]|uniref:Uncharacterized protein n=1 Tax=Thauera aminoaromatica TaxID=164330 RepID=A0A5C7T586_THASP|nr:hypothetical protein [Thauera aminoaromatica]TXH91458.1 MAG: hypothetical protein E6Q80_02670 [Thauera aminoaromatica]
MANKNVLLVFARRRQRAARRWEMAIGGVEGYKASIISEKIFKQRQFEVPSTQPVIFIGMSKPAEELRDVCSVAFSEYGATCYLGTRRAIVDCDWPDDQEEKWARSRAEVIAGAIQVYAGSDVGTRLAFEVPNLAQIEHDRQIRSSEGWANRSKSIAARWSGANRVADEVTGLSVRRHYIDLLYVYAATRFVAEQLDKFVAQ